MTLKEFTDWVKGIALVRELINPSSPPPVTPPKPPRKPRKPRKPTTEDT